MFKRQHQYHPKQELPGTLSSSHILECHVQAKVCAFHWLHCVANTGDLITISVVQFWNPVDLDVWNSTQLHEDVAIEDAYHYSYFFTRAHTWNGELALLQYWISFVHEDGAKTSLAPFFDMFQLGICSFCCVVTWLYLKAEKSGVITCRLVKAQGLVQFVRRLRHS